MNPYEVLGLHVTATESDIKRAYKRAALATHPDKVEPHLRPAAERDFKAISEAYEILRDPRTRELYDSYGMEGVRNGGPPGYESDEFDDESEYHFYSASSRGSRPHQGRHHHANHFHFSDPRRVFDEFFRGGDPFADLHRSLFNEMFAPEMSAFHNNQHARFQMHDPFFHPFALSPYPSSLFSPFPGERHLSGGVEPLAALPDSATYFSTQSSSSSRGGSRSSRTTVVNGEKTTVSTITDRDGKTTTETTRFGRDGKVLGTEVRENGKLISSQGVFALEGSKDGSRKRIA